LLLFLVVFIAAEWLQRGKQHALNFDNIKFPRFARWTIYFLIVFAIIEYGGSQQEFIYFQF
jgi:alginate O-acetyltransferase complex protein AlgI